MSDEQNLGQQFGEIPDEVKREHLRRSFAACCDAGRRGVTLTDAEREAVEWAVKFAGMSDCNGRRLATLRGLLERTKNG